MVNVMEAKRKKHPYYNYDKLCSYNAAYNFLVGGRGLGKTYGAKKKAIQNNIRGGEQFVYLRRHKNELKAARTTFFADLEHVFPRWDFRVNGATAERAPMSTRGVKGRVWITMGYFVALSTAQGVKGMSFHKVTTIIFDEFIIEKGLIRYLDDEATVFNNFYSTVDRYQDKTIVFFLANSVSIMNPYFLEYDIRPDEEKEFIVKDDGFICCHFPDSELFSNSVFETRFGKFIKGTDYADYAVGNKFDDNNEHLIKFKDGSARYMYTLESKHGIFSIWKQRRGDEYFIQKKLPGDQMIFTLEPSKMSEDKMLMQRNDKPLEYLRASFGTAKVSFDEPSTRNAFVDIFKR